MPPDRPKKPPACDFCKAKRVLCHPHPEGCPRCREKGVQCTTTPVCRRKRRTKAEIAADAAAEAEAASTTGSSRQTSTPRSRSSTSSPEAYISSWQTLSRVSSEASHDARRPAYESPREQQQPVLDGDSSISSTDTTLPIPPDPSLDVALACSASVSMVPTWSAMPAYPFTPALTEALCEAYLSSSIHGHPIVRASKWHESLRRNGWRVENLPRNLKVTALCGLGIGAAFSSDTAILHSFFASAAFDNAVFGTDLRVFGKQRQEAVRHLLRNAMDAANDAGVVFQPSIEHATSCYMLDVLMRLTEDNRARRANAHRPFAKAYASHVRGLFAAGGEAQGTALADDRTWAIHLAVDVCTEVASDGDISMTREEQELLVNLGATLSARDLKERYRQQSSIQSRSLPDAPPFFVLFLQIANRLKQDFLKPRLWPAPVDENALTTAIRSVAELRGVSESCRASFDLALGRFTLDYRPFLRSKEWSAESAAHALRDLIAYSWTTLVPPLHREIVRSVAELGLQDLDDDFELDSQQLRARLELLRQQSRQLLEHAVLQQADILEGHPALSMMIPARLTAVLDCAELWVDEAMNGRVTLNAQAGRVATSLSEALKAAGWVWAPARLDPLIVSLDAIASVISVAPPPALSPNLLSWALAV
ncbi:hypothetical protein JCM8115_002458 [Rhodotorula mucilaginosa]